MDSQAITVTEVSRSESVTWGDVLDDCSALMTKQEFWELLCGLFDAAGWKPPTRERGRVWYLALSDVTAPEFARAIGVYARQHSKEFLSIQLIRELAGVQTTTEDAAVLAWDAVLKAIRQYGAYYSVQFEDPAISAAIDAMGGWVVLCNKTSEELLKWTPKEFQKIYRAMSNTSRAAVPLVGVIERNNGFLGHRGAAVPVAHIGEAVNSYKTIEAQGVK